MDPQSGISDVLALQRQYSTEFVDPAILRTITAKYGTRFGRMSLKCAASSDGIVVKTTEGDDQAFEILNTFTRFPSLPIELRLSIFEESVESRNVMMYDAPEGRRNSKSRPIITPIVPVLFHVNREAREIATKVYKHTFFCFTSTASTASSQATLEVTLMTIPKALRPLVRRVVLKSVFPGVVGNLGLSWASFQYPYRTVKQIIYDLLKIEFGTLEEILIVDSVPALRSHTTLPSIQRNLECAHRIVKWHLLEEAKKEYPQWKAPKVFRQLVDTYTLWNYIIGISQRVLELLLMDFGRGMTWDGVAYSEACDSDRTFGSETLDKSFPIAKA
ncbi:hypothetical protein BKA64DRAFT_772269 [Cadophora sp. MPI-SDFR-AT-0126]|nr:hypothetical protein BKA64DRAFT_772269 [Leotiomycetes sp. MPI-SDFR-AT-0126]